MAHVSNPSHILSCTFQGIFQEGGIDLRAFQRVGVRGNLSRKLTRLMTQGISLHPVLSSGAMDNKHLQTQQLTCIRCQPLIGYLIDIKVLQNCIETNVGNLTFDVCGAKWTALNISDVAFLFLSAESDTREYSMANQRVQLMLSFFSIYRRHSRRQSAF